MDNADRPRPIRSRTFAALIESPEYRRYYFGQGISLIGSWLQMAAVSWIVFDRTGSERWLGIVDAAGTVPGLVVGLAAGALADRLVPRTMVLVMQVGQMLLAFLLAALVGAGTVQIWQMAVILALTRVCVTFELPSRQVFLYELVGKSTLMNAIALNSGLFNASRVIGPALAGVCLTRLGPTSCFVANGASYLAAIGALLTIRPRPRSDRPKGPEAGSGVLGGFAYLGRDRRVRSLFLLLTFFCIVGMGYIALVPAYARRLVGTAEAGYSLLLAAIGLGATAGALLVASLGGLRRRERLVAAGMLVFGLAMAAAGTAPVSLRRAGMPHLALYAGAACFFVGGFGAIVFFSSTQTLIQTAVPDHLRGRIMGIWMIVYSGSASLGSLWAGQLAQHRGVSLVLEVSAVSCVVVASLVMAGGVLAERPVAGDAVIPLRQDPR